jgi:hypothetical protein
MSASHDYRGRRAAIVENGDLRVTVLEEGGHIAEMLDKRSGINPLWTPPWPSIEPSTYVAARHEEYGSSSEAKLLAGIMGHNLCVDIFGAPSDEETAAGLTPHGEASVVRYQIAVTGQALSMRALLPLAEMRIERRLELRGRAIRIREIVENLAAHDRPIGWTEHVSLGPPFLEKGLTEFRASATRSKVFEHAVGADDYLAAGVAFDWPFAPCAGGGTSDLRRFTSAFGYAWKRRDFPWLGRWEENHSRTHAPWNGATLACGMEFGASPMPESRREMVDRGRLFDVPTYRWIPAKSRVEVEYWAIMRDADSVPELLRID